VKKEGGGDKKIYKESRQRIEAWAGPKWRKNTDSEEREKHETLVRKRAKGKGRRKVKEKGKKEEKKKGK